MGQRKVDDNIVLQLLREGKNQKQIAEYFNVSAVAIHKRLKKILPKPHSLEKLTPKEQKFVVAVAEGKSRTQAAMDSFDVSSRASAKAMQNVLMQKDDVKIAIDELMNIFGLTRGYRINKLKSHVDHVDPGVSLKALDQTWRLDGSFSPEKHIVGVIDYRALMKDMEACEARDMARLKELEALIAEEAMEAEVADPSGSIEKLKT